MEVTKLRVVKESKNEFTGKSGKVVQDVLVVLDEADNGLKNTMDFILDEQDKAKFGAQRVGALMSVNLSDIYPIFGGRLKLRGQVLHVA